VLKALPDRSRPVPTIEALTAPQWLLLKRLRIAALTDAPDAFGPSAEEVVAQPDSYWQAWARRSEEPGRRVFVAFIDGEAEGLVSAVGDDAGVGHIGAMWVAPAARRAHLGRALLTRGCDFLAESGCRRIVLTVTETNSPAIAMYTSHGFVLTGASSPLREGSPLANLEMALDLV
jgi:ribosomal protein S18 acetylase RimI-like enzyme